MKIFMRKSGFRVSVQIFMVLLVVSMFFAACGSDDPLNALGCPDNTTYCSGSGKCCQNGYPYHCNSGSASGTCYSDLPTNPPCTTYDYCSG
jgi:hypothetical protein